MTQLTLNLQGDLEATGEMKTSSSPVASRNYASHSLLQDKKKGQTMNATCGARCYEQFKKLNPHSSLLKMSLVSSTLMADWYSTRCALTWKLKATKFNRLLLVLQVKTHRTADIAAGLLEFLPTPMVSDWRGSKIKRKGNTQLTETLGISSQLNPRFVAEMMGFPPNWTELPFQNGDKNQSRVTETP